MTAETFNAWLYNIKAVNKNTAAIVAGSSLDKYELYANINKAIERVKELNYPVDDFKKEVEEVRRKIQERKEKNLEDIPSFFDGGKFRHDLMGDFLIDRFSVCKINNALHIYDNGIYKCGGDILYGYMIELYPQIRDAQRKEVFKYMKASMSTPVKEVSPPNLIPFATKIYNIETDEFINYSPEHVFLNRFPYDYIQNAPESPMIANTIKEIANFDEEVEQSFYMKRSEIVSNLLNSFRGSVMLYGDGRNGKSTLMNIILQVVGNKNASKLSLQNLSERFMLADIYGKAANIGDDIPSAYIPDTSIFKKLVTGEYVQAERKGQDPFSFYSYAKLFFSMNELPPVGEKSKGFFSRVLLIPLKRTFEQGNNANTNLKFRKWSQQEMEYLVRLAMDGLKRLLSNGTFTMPGIVKEALREYEIMNNPIKEFLEDRKNYRPIKLPKPTEELYSEFGRWCDQSGHKNKMTRYKFTQAVSQGNRMEKRISKA